MIIHLDDSLNSLNGQVAKDVADLVLAVAKMGHNLSCSSSLWHKIEQELLSIYTYLGRWDVEVIRSNKAMRDITVEKRRYLSTLRVGLTKDMFFPSEALCLLNTPSMVIVENEENDWAVIRKWIDLLKNDRQFKSINTIVCKRKDQGDLKPYNAGSSGQIVNTIHQRERELRDGTKYKVSVVVDSDKSSNTDPLTTEKEGILREMKQAGIQGHILCKREMENYFPLSTYRAAGFVKDATPIPLYTDEEWDFLDIENAPFISYKKKQLPQLAEYIDKNMLVKRVGTYEDEDTQIRTNEIQQLVLKLAKLC